MTRVTGSSKVFLLQPAYVAHHMAQIGESMVDCRVSGLRPVFPELMASTLSVVPSNAQNAKNSSLHAIAWMVYGHDNLHNT